MPDQTLTEARTAALDAIRRYNVNPVPHPLQWRVIITDSESMTGIAPVCPAVNDTTGLHVIADYPGGPIQDDTGVYDCCPTPWIEAGHGEIAAYLVALLNADWCMGPGEDRNGVRLVCCKLGGHVAAGDLWHDMIPAGTATAAKSHMGGESR
jgi:hypothetical protein